MHWSEFQDTADRLSQGKSEGDWRSAISRGYYAVFHYFREFLLSNGLPIGTGGQAHYNLYVGLWNCGIPGVAAIGQRIGELRNRRTSADYELKQPLSHSKSVVLVKECRVIVADFQALLGSVTPTPIVSGARRYLQSIGRLGKTP